MDDVNLTEVRLIPLVSDPRKVLDRCAEMRIPFDAEAGEQANAVSIFLAEAMGTARTYGDNDAFHSIILTDFVGKRRDKGAHSLAGTQSGI